MPKAVVQIGWDHYVVDLDAAVAFATMMTTAESYLTKGYGEARTHYVWDQEPSRALPTIQLIPDSLYRMAKLAGKPADE